MSQSQQLEPRPLPTGVSLTPVQAEGESWVRLDFLTFQGVSVFFIHVDQAKQLGEQIVKLSSTAKSGLILANSIKEQ